jgi:hypothetical protein
LDLRRSAQRGGPRLTTASIRQLTAPPGGIASSLPLSRRRFRRRFATGPHATTSQAEPLRRVSRMVPIGTDREPSL